MTEKQKPVCNVIQQKIPEIIETHCMLDFYRDCIIEVLKVLLVEF